MEADNAVFFRRATLATFLSMVGLFVMVKIPLWHRGFALIFFGLPIFFLWTGVTIANVVKIVKHFRGVKTRYLAILSVANVATGIMIFLIETT
jgi:hypothetical protein